MKKINKFLVIMALVIIGVSVYADEIRLTILHTNDIHGQLVPFDYTFNNPSNPPKQMKVEPNNIGGAARRATYINNVRKFTDHTVLLLDAGDTFTRGPLESLEGEPEFEIMNALKYDVLTLGNNEFKADQYTGNFTPKAVDILNERIKEADFPVIAGNVYDKITGKRVYTPYIFKNIEGMRLAIIGVTAYRVKDYPQAANLNITDPVAEIGKILDEIKGKYDFVILLSHAGVIDDFSIAGKYQDLDLIIGGDSHTWIYKPVLTWNNKSGMLSTQAGELGVAVGRIDLVIEKQSDNRYIISKYAGELVPITDKYPEDGNIKNIVDKYYKIKNDASNEK